MNTKRVEAIVAQVLGVPPEQINDDSGPGSLTAWDSVTHIDIMLSMEVEFSVSLSADEMVSLLSVGALKQALAAKGVHG
jgi:acyl carrier protein